MYYLLYNEYMPNRSIRGISLRNWTWLKVAAIEQHTTMGDLLNQILDEQRMQSRSGSAGPRIASQQHYDGDEDGCYESDGMLYRARQM